MRESPALDILELLVRRGARVSFSDPYVSQVTLGGHSYESVPFDQAVKGSEDCAVVATDHSVFDYARIAALPLVVDTRNALKSFAKPSIFSL